MNAGPSFFSKGRRPTSGVPGPVMAKFPAAWGHRRLRPGEMAAVCVVGAFSAMFLLAAKGGGGGRSLTSRSAEEEGWRGGGGGVVMLEKQPPSARSGSGGWQTLFPHRRAQPGVGGGGGGGGAGARSAAKHLHHRLLSSLELQGQFQGGGPGAEEVPEDEAEVGRGDFKEPGAAWGSWRTPGNANQYDGMTSPVENNNPFGENVVGKDSDRAVNASLAGEEGAFSPFQNILEGNGPLPKMFSSSDMDVPCDQEDVDCEPVKANIVSTDESTEDFNARMKRHGHLKRIGHYMQDHFVNCSDPDEQAVNPACDPGRNKYGRPDREGGFADDPMIVESRMHYRQHWMPSRNSEDMWGSKNFFVYPDGRVVLRYPLNTSGSFYAHGPVRPDGPAGMRVPYPSTGHYGGLTGPPYNTQGPPGGELGAHGFLGRDGLHGRKIDGLKDDQYPAQALADHQIVRHHILLGHPGDWIPKEVTDAIAKWGDGHVMYRGMRAISGRRHTGKVESVEPMLQKAEKGVKEARGKVKEVKKVLLRDWRRRVALGQDAGPYPGPGGSVFLAPGAERDGDRAAKGGKEMGGSKQASGGSFFDKILGGTWVV